MRSRPLVVSSLVTLIAAAALTIAAVPLAAEPTKPIERQRLLAHLDMTEQWLVGELDGLSADQLKFRMTPEGWSIMDVVEHLAIAEPQYWKQLQDSLKQQAVGADKEKMVATDDGILWYGIDRTNRAKTGEARVPKGRFTDVKESLAEFRKLRATMREFAKTTQEEMRGRRLLEGNMDVYQWFLMISTHSQRHLLQIREIKAHASYPRK